MKEPFSLRINMQMNELQLQTYYSIFQMILQCFYTLFFPLRSGCDSDERPASKKSSPVTVLPAPEDNKTAAELRRYFYIY